MTQLPKKKRVRKEEDFYCKKCGGCGYIGCCGIRKFLKEHVENKTDCPNESTVIQEIIEYVEETETFNLNFPDGDKTKLRNNYQTISYKMVNGKKVKIAERNIGTKKSTTTL